MRRPCRYRAVESSPARRNGPYGTGDIHSSLAKVASPRLRRAMRKTKRAVRFVQPRYYSARLSVFQVWGPRSTHKSPDTFAGQLFDFVELPTLTKRTRVDDPTASKFESYLNAHGPCAIVGSHIFGSVPKQELTNSEGTTLTHAAGCGPS